ncbi:unnamed protein product [Phaedon cochleariae]|uniref:Uncharacterized protein n=1 Tax=Phaedon cochleariae TaxID=80249 RepID=A0A9P0DVU6_PHACE|nr:unnamed protein product [Phaedon cochleariae]
MVSDHTNLPFFPKYETDRLFDDKLSVTWFETNFSQSHYNVHNISRGSNACTLIAILVAAKCNKYKILINKPENCLTVKLVQVLALSMLEGNQIHENLKLNNKLKHINLNVPEAISFADKDTKGIVEWKNEVFMEPLAKSLYTNIRIHWRNWVKSQMNNEPSDLYLVLVADARTVLFIFQIRSETITLVDSHQHSAEKGAFIAIAHCSILKYLCEWYTKVLFKFNNSVPQLYELSFLYFKKS